MPFTLSHAAAVIPLARSPLVPSALVIGSMAPDVPYLFSIGALRGTTHSPLGIVTVDLAVGMALFAVFHLIWKRPLVALAPPWLRARLARPASALNWHRAVRWAPLSLLIGIVTHVLWDAFTHRNHSFADALPWLVTISAAGLELYRWLQYASGLLGATAIIWWTLRWLRRADADEEQTTSPPSTRNVRLAWACLAGAGTFGGLLGATTLPNQPPGTPWGLHAAAASGVVYAIGGVLLALTAYSLIWLKANTRRPPDPPPTPAPEPTTRSSTP